MTREVTWLYLIPLLPLLGAAFNGLLGRAFGRDWVNAVANGVMFVAFLISVAVFMNVNAGDALHQTVYEWFAAGTLKVDVGFRADRLTSVMLLVVTGVGFLIHFYSIGYMAEDPGHARYFAYLNLFAGAMLILVLGDSLVTLFVGWEGVGLCSYLLIGFWYEDPAKAYAGRKAFVVNRIGDLGFLIGIFTLVALAGTTNIEELLAKAEGWKSIEPLSVGPWAGWPPVLVAGFACVMLFVGAAGKSAQLPLYVWLPDAMAGPTPVSALIHAATMVTAGVYMIARLDKLFLVDPRALALVTIVATLTALWSALIAFAQNDIKKVLAYSTVSQLGFMFIGVGVGAFEAGVAHLVTHAFFKACLFLGAGSVMHALSGEGDIRKMGGLAKKIPHTRWTFLIATIAITGVVPLSGFFSKDEILHQALTTELWKTAHYYALPLAWVGKFAYAVGTLTALCTAFYMWRLYFKVFHGEYRGTAHPHESPGVMTGPLWILALLSIVAAYWLLPGRNLFAEWMGEGLGHFDGGVAMALGIAWLVALAGFYVAAQAYAGSWQKLPERIATSWPRVYGAFTNKFYVDEVYDLLISRPLWGLSRVFHLVMDTKIIDRLFVHGSAKVADWTGLLLRYGQNGDVQRYAAVLVIGAAVLLAAWLG
jgi:NADH-quinone oxidoreductase subunit L